MKTIAAIFVLLIALVPHSARSNSIDYKQCTAGLPGFNAFVMMREDGKLLVEGSKFYEKKNTNDPNVTEHHFRTANKVLHDISDGTMPETAFVRTKVMQDRTSNDFLRIHRDGDGRIVTVSAQSQDLSTKGKSLVLTDSGWKPAPTAHSVSFRYQGQKCLKTSQMETDHRGRTYITYSEEICDELFPLIEKMESGADARSATRIQEKFMNMESEGRKKAASANVAPPVLGDPGAISSSLASTERALRFARGCIEARGDLATWKALRAPNPAPTTSVAPGASTTDN